MGMAKKGEGRERFAPLSITIISLLLVLAAAATLGGCASLGTSLLNTATTPASGKTTTSSLPTTTASASTTTSSTLRPFRVAAWSRGDMASLAKVVGAGTIDEVDLDWWHCRADGSLVPELLNPAEC